MQQIRKGAHVTRSTFVFLAVFALGCPPGEEGPSDSGSRVWKEGDACGGLNQSVNGGLSAGSLCADAGLLLECRGPNYYEGGYLVAVPCRGPNGCITTTDNKVICDNTRGILNGDRCAGGQEGGGACSDDAGTYFVCSDGGFVQGSHCDGGCSISGDSVYCNP